MIATNNKKNFTSHKSNQSNSYMYVLCQSVFPPTASLALQLANSILSSKVEGCGFIFSKIFRSVKYSHIYACNAAALL